MDLGYLIGFVASLITIIGLIIGYKKAFDDVLDALELPVRPTISFLIVCSFIAALLGGLVWNYLNSVNDHYHFFGPSPYVGGTSSEPHGITAIIWPIATNVLLIVALVLLAWRYHFPKIRYRPLLYIVFLIGITIGSLIFYDFPFGGKDGLRNFYDSQNKPFLEKEFWLVVWWSLLLSGLGFLFVELTKIIVARTKDLRTLLKHFGTWLGQSILCVGLTALSVLCFLLVFPDQPRFDTARGIIAGLALRMTLFFGLLIGINPVALNLLAIFRRTWPSANPPAPGSPPGSP